MSSFDDLLVVQEHDTRIDQLRHRREHLDELEVAAGIRAELATLDGRRASVGSELADIRGREQRLEDEAATVQAKAADVHGRLYDGSVVAHRELEDLQEDHRLLTARQGQLEEQAIELMEQAEPLAAALAELDAARAVLQGRLDEVEQVIAAAWAEIDTESGPEEAGRSAASAASEPAVLSDYTSLRRRIGGIGAARLSGARCEGCHLEIPPAELDEVRRAPSDATVFCPQCSRILVR